MTNKLHHLRAVTVSFAQGSIPTPIAHCFPNGNASRESLPILSQKAPSSQMSSPITSPMDASLGTPSPLHSPRVSSSQVPSLFLPTMAHSQGEEISIESDNIPPSPHRSPSPKITCLPPSPLPPFAFAEPFTLSPSPPSSPNHLTISVSLPVIKPYALLFVPLKTLLPLGSLR